MLNTQQCDVTREETCSVKGDEHSMLIPSTFSQIYKTRKHALPFLISRHNLICSWDPHTQQKNIDKLEQVQRYAARYVTSNFSQTASVNKDTTRP